MKPIDISIDNLDPNKDLEIDRFDLNEALMKYPGIMAKYGIAAQKASEEFDKARDYHKETVAMVSNEVKGNYVKITIKDLENKVELDERVLSAKKKMNRAKWDLETVKVILDAMRAKKDMLITYSSNIRAEIK